MRSRLLVGAHVIVYINGTAYGRVADMGWSEETPRREIRGVDSLTPFELVQSGAVCRGNMSIFRLHADGGIEATGMKATWRDLTKEKYFSILVLDRSTDTVVFQADKCSVVSQSWRVGRGYVMGAINFSTMSWNNETPDASDE
jgi:hypothetical protein